MTDLVVVVRAEVDGDEREPHDARAVHGEADVLCLVEVLRDLSRAERVERAQYDEEHVVEEREDERQVAHAARQHGGERLRVDLLRAGPLHDEPHDAPAELDRRQAWNSIVKRSFYHAEAGNAVHLSGDR